ncbi:MAG: kelch repeat-containing protein [Planctomycetota bacterium]
MPHHLPPRSSRAPCTALVLLAIVSAGRAQAPLQWASVNLGHQQLSSQMGSVPIGNLVYDSGRDRFVFYNGNYDGTLWEWRPDTWLQRRPTTSPPPRATTAVAFDRRRGRMVVFGGLRAPSGTPLQDTWEWDGESWLQIATPNPPPGGRNYRMLFDSTRDRIVLGGVPYTGSANGLWTYDGADWFPLSTSRNLDRVTYDLGRQRFVMVQNTTLGLRVRESVDGITYVDLDPPAGSPRPHNRQSFGMAVHPPSGELLVTGGQWVTQLGTTPPGNRAMTDTWSWDGIAWTEHTGTAPAGGNYPLVCGGDGFTMMVDQFSAPGEVWTWGGLWSKRMDRPQVAPAGRNALVYDTGLRRPIQFCYRADLGNRTAPVGWNGETWGSYSGFGPPPLREFAVAYHEGVGRTLLFGGFELLTGNLSAGAWTWADSGYQTAASGPSARENHRMTYDSDRQQVVLFGGNDRTRLLDDTWTWDGSGWLLRQPTVTPPPREHHALAHDPSRQRTVMFGGAVSADTWEWDGATWQQRLPATTPPAQQQLSMVYHRWNQRIVMVGTATWEWDGVDWRQLPVPFTPSPHVQASMTYDPVRRTPILVADRTWLLTDERAVVRRYGQGCAGSSSEPELEADLPYLGNRAMQLRLATNASVFCAFMLSIAPDNIPFGAGCTVLVQFPTFLFEVRSTSQFGDAALGLPIPADPYFIGASVFAQAVAFDPFGQPTDLVATDGIQLQFGL